MRSPAVLAFALMLMAGCAGDAPTLSGVLPAPIAPGRSVLRYEVRTSSRLVDAAREWASANGYQNIWLFRTDCHSPECGPWWHVKGRRDTPERVELRMSRDPGCSQELRVTLTFPVSSLTGELARELLDFDHRFKNTWR